MDITLTDSEFKKIRNAILFLEDVVEPESIDLVEGLKTLQALHVKRDESNEAYKLQLILNKTGVN